MPKINRRSISRALENMGKRLKDDTSVLKDDGQHIDIDALNAHHVVVATVAELKALGVKDRKHLMKLGFMPAGMILSF